MCRIVNVLFDVASTALIYLILFRITRKQNTALLGAFIFAIIPFEVIQSQWMRPHTLANFFVLTAVYYSTFLLVEPPKKHLYLKIGLFCGFATATRYPSLVVFLFPLALLPAVATREGVKNKLQWISKKAGIMWFSWLLGFFLADPFIFINWHDARNALLTEKNTYADASQFHGLRAMLDLSKTWGHVNWIIPYGTFPLLWVLFYASILYLLFEPKWRTWFLALSATLACNLFLMTKGYLATPEFVRTVIFTFPFFAMISALAIQVFFEQRRNKSFFYFGGIAALVLVLGSTLAFDLSYVWAMDEQKDVRTQLYHYLSQEIGARTGIEVGLAKESPYNYFIGGSPLQALRTNHLVTDFEERELAAYTSGTSHRSMWCSADSRGMLTSINRSSTSSRPLAGTLWFEYSHGIRSCSGGNSIIPTYRMI